MTESGSMRLSDARGEGASVQGTLAGFCPVCGEKVVWTPTGQLWPSKKVAQAVLSSQSGICSHCDRVLMFTIVSGPAED